MRGTQRVIALGQAGGARPGQDQQKDEQPADAHRGGPMTSSPWHKAACIAALAGAAGAPWAQPADDLGRSEYLAHCASCHGTSGKGDGPLRRFLTQAPSDLTTLAQRSGGALPTQLVWEIIDGRASGEIGPHGTRDMPVWGATYRSQALAVPGMAAQPEWYVRGRIVALIDYLQRIQAK
jgi:mono/diheme cytochrome c family protein